MVFVINYGFLTVHCEFTYFWFLDELNHGIPNYGEYFRGIETDGPKRIQITSDFTPVGQ